MKSVGSWVFDRKGDEGRSTRVKSLSVETLRKSSYLNSSYIYIHLINRGRYRE